MKTNKREGWRKCENCVHRKVCTIVGTEADCFDHIYDADAERYGDITALLHPVFDWLNHHYPNDAVFLVDHNSARLLVDHKSFFSDSITKMCTDIFSQTNNAMKENGSQAEKSPSDAS